MGDRPLRKTRLQGGSLDDLREEDVLKFVICDRGDYEWSREQLAKYRLATRCEVLFSPGFDRQDAAELALQALYQLDIARQLDMVDNASRAQLKEHTSTRTSSS